MPVEVRRVESFCYVAAFTFYFSPQFLFPSPNLAKDRVFS